MLCHFSLIISVACFSSVQLAPSPFWGSATNALGSVYGGIQRAGTSVIEASIDAGSSIANYANEAGSDISNHLNDAVDKFGDLVDKFGDLNDDLKDSDCVIENNGATPFSSLNADPTSPSPASCRRKCQEHSSCQWFNYIPAGLQWAGCWLIRQEITGFADSSSQNRWVTGPKYSKYCRDHARSSDIVSLEGFESLASGGHPELHQSPEVFQVQFDTDISDKPIVVEVNRTLAPIGADRFYELVMAGFYDTGALFRVVPGFVLQFGISGDPDQNEAWLHNSIQDDPVVGTNVAGTVSYAATSEPNSRTTQVFINYVDNTFLDDQGFAPLGRVVLGLDVAMAVHNPTPGHSLGVDQQMYEEKANDWIRDQYPGINFIQSATVRQSN